MRKKIITVLNSLILAHRERKDALGEEEIRNKQTRGERSAAIRQMAGKGERGVAREGERWGDLK